jgi:hypothetical protein
VRPRAGTKLGRRHVEFAFARFLLGKRDAVEVRRGIHLEHNDLDRNEIRDNEARPPQVRVPSIL